MDSTLICVIDDDMLYQHLMKRVITKMIDRPEILQFENGRKAMDFIIKNAAIKARLPQLIFLDINMPVLNGWQFLREFCSLPSVDYTPLIYLTSSSCDNDDIKIAASFPILSGYLIKPVRQKDLASILDRTYNGKAPA